VRKSKSIVKPGKDSLTKKQIVLPKDLSGRPTYFGVPLIIAPPDEDGFNNIPKTSVRLDGITDSKTLIALPYPEIRKDDILYSERIWRDIDTREKINQPFRYKQNSDKGDERFINILVEAVRTGQVTAFDPTDDRFTTPLDSIAFEKILLDHNECDTIPIYNPYDATKIDSYFVSCNYLRPDDIIKYRIKEDWIFDKATSRMMVRIIGIAPLKTIWSIDKKTERGYRPLFWLYYPDLRPILVNREVYNPKNMGNARMTWEELFESRMFGSQIVKSSMDNSQGKYLSQLFPGDKRGVLRLLEGENVREKIFNYEQDLWSY
jgi:gliding motility associated protien GldN